MFFVMKCERVQTSKNIKNTNLGVFIRQPYMLIICEESQQKINRLLSPDIFINFKKESKFKAFEFNKDRAIYIANRTRWVCVGRLIVRSCGNYRNSDKCRTKHTNCKHLARQKSKSKVCQDLASTVHFMVAMETHRLYRLV